MIPIALHVVVALLADPSPASRTSAVGASAPAVERLTADTSKETVLGNPFIAPAGWTVTVRGQATILTAPEADSWIALVDVPEKDAKDAEAALKAAWVAYKPDAKWPL